MRHYMFLPLNLVSIAPTAVPIKAITPSNPGVGLTGVVLVTIGEGVIVVVGVTTGGVGVVGITFLTIAKKLNDGVFASK